MNLINSINEFTKVENQSLSTTNNQELNTNKEKNNLKD